VDRTLDLRRCKSSRYNAYRCGLRLAAHAKPGRAHPQGVVQRFLSKPAPYHSGSPPREAGGA
jgi:hypothetical protein